MATTSSVPIQVGNTIINFPTSGASPDWSAAIVAFAEAVALQLEGISLPSDVQPAVQILSSDANTNLPLTGVTFPNATVRSFIFTYAVYRTNGVLDVVEQGTVNGIYDTGSGSWLLDRDYKGTKQTDGTSYQTFTMSGDNLLLNTVAIGGSYNSTMSTISYSAKTELVTNA
jgi:hypothetical protein